MSYDLLFCVPKGEKVPSGKELSAFFSGRRHYDVAHGEAFYDNPATGTVFSFNFEDWGQEQWEPDEAVNSELLEKGFEQAPLAFGVTYGLALTAAKEVAKEVNAVLGAFRLRISDPQTGEIGPKKFSAETLRKGIQTGASLLRDVLK